MKTGTEKWTTSDIFRIFKDLSRMPNFFFFRNNYELYTIFGAIEHIEFLTLEERYAISRVPINLRYTKTNKKKTNTQLNLITGFIEQFASERDSSYIEKLSNGEIDEKDLIWTQVQLPLDFDINNPFLN